jgi:hypothetical protein
MTAPAWPIAEGIGSAFQLEGLSGVPYLPVVHTPPGTGPSLSNQTDDITFTTWSGTVKLTSAELTTFRAWVRDTIYMGSLAFLWKDPHDKTEKLYKLLAWDNIAALGNSYWSISITVEEQPD